MPASVINPESTSPRDLSGLLAKACENSLPEGRPTAVQELRSMTVTRTMATDLLGIVRRADHPAMRTVAAQVLGYHESARLYPELQAVLLASAETDPDLTAAKAAAFALCGTASGLALLDCGRPQVVVEAILGATEDDASVELLLRAYFSTDRIETESLLLAEISTFDVASRAVVELLVSDLSVHDSGDFERRVRRLFAALPPASLLVSLARSSYGIERTFRGIWPDLHRREAREELIEILGATVEGREDSEDLLVKLTDLIRRGELSLPEERRLVQTVVRSLSSSGAEPLLELVGRIGSDADKIEKGRLSHLVTELARTYPELGTRIGELFDAWEPDLPGVRMKAFHARIVSGS